MRIVILTAGTRGDVQPYVALARGLSAAGDAVTVATGSNFEGFVRAQGVDFAPLRVDYYELINSDEGKALKSGNPIGVMQNMKTTVLPLFRRLLEDVWAAAQGADLIIYHPKVLGSNHVAEKLGVPCILAATVPIIAPTSAFPAPGVISRNLGGTVNRLTYKAVQAAAGYFDGLIREWRVGTLGLPPRSTLIDGYTMNGRPLPVLYCYSAHVLPAPSDWGAENHVTGYWFLDEAKSWQPPADLTAFLDAGAPPVYVGFGSMVADDPRYLTQVVIEALAQTGQRGVIATGWGGLDDLAVPPTIYRLKEAPHEWLFPRMAAVVHHGGAGTVAAGLRAGKPTVISPFIADQPFWGNVLHHLGVSPKPIPQKHLTANKLAAAIRQAVGDAPMRQRAEAVGAAIRAEDGVANAVQVIHRVIR